MYKKLIGLLLSAFCVWQVQAQKATPKYTALVSGGLVGGEGGPALQVQAINGLAYRSWSAGFGVGLDYYHTRSVPVFVDLRKAFTEKQKTGFVYLDGGYNMPWLGENETFLVVDSKGGLYAEGGVGFATPVFGSKQFFFSCGWQIKTLTKTMNSMPWLSVWPPPKEAFRDYEYRLSCFTMKAGLRF